VGKANGAEPLDRRRRCSYLLQNWTNERYATNFCSSNVYQHCSDEKTRTAVRLKAAISMYIPARTENKDQNNLIQAWSTWMWVKDSVFISDRTGCAMFKHGAQQTALPRWPFAKRWTRCWYHAAGIPLGT